MEPNEHPEYRRREEITFELHIENKSLRADNARLQAERDMLAIQLEQAEAREVHMSANIAALKYDHGAELAGLQADVGSYSDIAKDYFAELTVLRERVAKANAWFKENGKRFIVNPSAADALEKILRGR
jgi:uncharacterized protein YlxW (UPF0749 family)